MQLAASSQRAFAAHKQQRGPELASPHAVPASVRVRSTSTSSLAHSHGLSSAAPAALTASFSLPSRPRPLSCPPAATPFDSVRDFDGGYGSAARRTATSSPTSAPPNPDMSDLTPEEQRTVRLFQDNSRSVVNVSTTISAVSMFNPFSVQQIPRGVGSGFIWDKQGHVITNAHVVAQASEVSVTLSDGATHKAKVIGKDREKDIAVLKISDISDAQAASLRPVVLGCSSNLMVGQKVLAIGNPFGLDQTLTQGIVSGLGREVGPQGAGGYGGPTITNGIQTDAAINPGNSGGPLLDSSGRVVGINTAILDPTGVGISSGIGFAIPIDAVRGMVSQILTVGRVVRPAMGITIAPVPTMVSRFGDSASSNGTSNSSNGTSKVEGVLVVSVRGGSPADVAGIRGTRREMFGALRLGDIIVSINGKPIKQQKDLFSTLDNCSVGEMVEVGLLNVSTGGKRTVRVVLADRERLAGSE